MKNNKKVWIVFIFAVILVALFIILWIGKTNSKNLTKHNKKAVSEVMESIKEDEEQAVGSFKLASYQEEIDSYNTYRPEGINYPTDLNVGKISDAAEAAEKAKQVWKDILHVKKDPKEINVYVAYDSEENCWYMHNIKPKKPETLGGVYHAIIRNNGDVLAVWFEG